MMKVFWAERDAFTLPADDGWLSASERAVLGRLHIAKRRGDWRLGRWAAKCALSGYLEITDLQRVEIRAAASGAPEAYVDGSPAGASISITHSGGVGACCVVEGNAAVGCDLEHIEPRSDAFLADYFTTGEREFIALAAEPYRTATILWSAKESVLKAIHQGLRLDTRSVEIWGIQGGVPGAGWRPFHALLSSDQMLRGWWQAPGTLVRTVCGSPAPLPPSLR